MNYTQEDIDQAYAEGVENGYENGRDDGFVEGEKLWPRD